MEAAKPTVLVTGIAGNLGLRLLPQLEDFFVVGVDINTPTTTAAVHFVRLDLGLEESCRRLYHLLRETRPVAVIHLAFVIDPVRTGIFDLNRMWQINVAGISRGIESIKEGNHKERNAREKSIFFLHAFCFFFALFRSAVE